MLVTCCNTHSLNLEIDSTYLFNVTQCSPVCGYKDGKTLEASRNISFLFSFQLISREVNGIKKI